MIWLLLIVPVITVGLLMAVPKWRHQTVWWEVAIPIAITALTIVICQCIAVSSATNDKEYWGNLGVKVIHEEPFAYDSECAETYPCGQT